MFLLDWNLCLLGMVGIVADLVLPWCSELFYSQTDGSYSLFLSLQVVDFSNVCILMFTNEVATKFVMHSCCLVFFLVYSITVL